MSTTIASRLYDPAVAHRALSASAKSWWGGSLAAKFIAFVLSLLTILTHLPPELIAIAVVLLAVIAELAGFKADALKGDASLLLRRLDFLDALGWSISSPEYSDLLVRRESLLSKEKSTAVAERYWASRSPTGAARAVENTMESAWWSKHLSLKMTKLCFVFSVLSVALSFTVLFASLLSAQSTEGRVMAARVAISIIGFVLSFGLVKLTLSYWQFSQKAAKSEQAALVMLENAGEIEAIKLMQEYDLVRAGSPLIPDWLWARNRPILNQLWKEFRAQQGEAASSS